MINRKTQQRKWIRVAFEQHDRPLTPQEVLELAQENISGLGIATVYRNLKHLHQEGWLRPVEFPGEPTRYERAGKDHHHFFHCDGCGKVFAVPGRPGDIASLTPDDFEVRRHEVLLYGCCGSCREVGVYQEDLASVG